MKSFSRFLMCSCVALVLAPVQASAESSYVYVTNSAGDSLHVVDTATNEVVQVIDGVLGAHGVNFSPDGSRVYVSVEPTHTLNVYDQHSGALIKAVPLSNRPNNISVAPDGRIVVAIARGEGALDIIDPVSLEVRKSVPVHGGLHNVYVTPDGKYVIAGSTRTAIFTAIDLETETVAWEHQFDHSVRPMSIETNPDGSTKRVYVQLGELDGFAVLDFATHEEIARITLPYLGTLVDVDPGRADAPSHGIGVTPDNRTVWVTSIPQNAVFIYSTEDLSLLGHVGLPDLQLPEYPLGGAVANWVTFTPDGSTIYISNSGLRSVTAIDTATRQIKAVIPVGEVPKRINTLVMN
jgi:YVTN family beta-propeller protein